ncbi:hypothetical protein J2X31_003301 [Flavobacterium arsenatis]|uniref:Uncharacterized protein n=1 Tax=Flavobacterium arsenatis TaxID=1484332 RepID=A0ABU1TTS6_9FLAO|nr:hypothetical protein [Flavobacterium arsenatis]
MKKNLLIAFLLTYIYSNVQCWESISVGERHVLGIQTGVAIIGLTMLRRK